METAGLWMLAAVAIIMVITGMPAWTVLIGVATISAVIGLAAGAFTLPVLTALPYRLLGLLDNDLLQALPLYVLMGALLNRLPLAEIVFRVGRWLLRRSAAAAPLTGLGLGMLLAPMNGSVGASVVILSKTVQPKLDENHTPPSRTAALVCVASTLGVVIPPSLVLILLGDAMMRAHTEAAMIAGPAGRIINTQDVFRGALIPAAVTLLLCTGVAWWTNRRAASSAGGFELPAPGRADHWLAAVTVAIIVGLLGAVTLGYLYAVEAAATGGLALFAFGLATRTLTRAVLLEVLRDTMAVTGALFALLLAATTFTLVLRAFETDRWIASALAGMAGDRASILLVALGGLALCAFVLDAFEMIFVVVPVVMPPLLAQVPDPTWVAVLTLLLLQISFLLPPLGYAVMMARHAMTRPLPSWPLARALLPYLLAQITVLSLVLLFPAMVWRDPATLAAPTAPQGQPDSSQSLEDLIAHSQEEPQKEEK
jgi:TRAP-type mannitol/chloroaromatic compound transport system permease large subunit